MSAPQSSSTASFVYWLIILIGFVALQRPKEQRHVGPHPKDWIRKASVGDNVYYMTRDGTESKWVSEPIEQSK